MTQPAPFAPQPFPSTDDVFGTGGLLARAFPGYEPRPGQVEMTTRITDAFKNGKRLLVEGPTGTGKSVAYLMPAIRAYAETATKTIVATSNIALQEQIVRKDLPALVRVLRRPFRFALLKGTSNYLCREALDDALLDPKTSYDVHDLASWAQRTIGGDLTELDRELSPRVRQLCTTSAEDCLGKKCPQNSSCFVVRARQDARAAHVIVVNYHLYFADLALRAEGNEGILPDHGAVILDELHNAAEIARSFFGRRLSFGSVMHAQRRLLSVRADLAKELERAASSFFEHLDAYRRSDEYRSRLSVVDPVPSEDLHGLLRTAAMRLRDAVPEQADEHQAKRIGAAADTADRQAAFLRAAMTLTEKENTVYSVTLPEGQKGVALVGEPIDVAPLLRQHVWESARLGTVVGTSATLGDGRTFDLVAREVGAEGAAQIAVPSPFDWPRQAVVAVPPGLPTPSDPRWPAAVNEALVAAIHAAHGRTLALFTSKKMLEAAHRHVLAARLPYTILCQGEAPRTKLVERFREDVSSVLLGTASLWEGVDVPGEACSCVVIDKLPFDSPDDPVMSVLEERRGRRFFNEVMVPRAVLRFRQGAGRLIRTATDRGTIVLLDDRVLSKPYGRKFLSGLPEGVRVLRDDEWAADVEKFLGDGVPF